MLKNARGVWSLTAGMIAATLLAGCGDGIGGWFGKDGVPVGFSLIAPGDGATEVDLRPTLSWQDSGRATSYTLWLRAGDAGFTDDDRLVVVAPWTTSFAVTSDLVRETTYYWRVIAHNGQGETPCEGKHSFIAGVEPPWIDSEPLETVWVGEEYAYQVLVSGDPEPAVTVEGLPDWLTFDDETFTFSGVPDSWGIYGPITVTASNGYGSDDQRVFSIHVRAALAWGNDDHGQLGVNGGPTLMLVQIVGPDGEGFLTEVAAVSASEYHTVALMTDGTVWAWGYNRYGQLGEGTTLNRSSPVQVEGPGGVGFLTDVSAISAGRMHTVALKTDGTVWAWGSNTFGKLGDGTTVNRSSPVQVKAPGGMGYLTDVATISAGDIHTVALKTNGTVWAWGWNYYGEIGDGTTTQRNTPVQVKGPGGMGFLTDVAAISAGGCHTIALKTDGTVWAWGSNTFGKLGDGTTTSSVTPVQVNGSGGTGFLTDITAISAGIFHTIALKTDGTVWAWGSNSFGKLGDGTTVNRSSPVQVIGPDGTGFLTDVTAISAGLDHTVALKTDRTVWAWGCSFYGQIGDGTTIDRTVPVQVKGPGGMGYLTDVAAISAGGGHTVAHKTDGTVWAWGSKEFGQLGDGTTTSHSAPLHVKASGGEGFLTSVSAMSAGNTHSIALKTDGTVWAWGDNLYGQLGDGTTSDRSVPVQVKGPDGTGCLTNIVALSAGDSHTIALKTDGTVWAWGYNASRQLGDGTWTARNIPVQVKGPGGTGLLTGVSAITTGSSHTIALMTDGTVWAWGDNWYGQLGDGTTSDWRSPLQVKGPGGTGILMDVVAISAGRSHTVALKTDGTVYTWGSNASGQLGDGTATSRYTPVQVVGPGGTGILMDIVAIYAGRSHTVALKIDGTVLAWGYNQYGQIGDGTTSNRRSPVQVKGSSDTGFLTDVAAISAGDIHTVALKTNGTVWEWGYNIHGQLGNGTTASSYTPVQVVGPGGVGFLERMVGIAAGGEHTLAW